MRNLIKAGLLAVAASLFSCSGDSDSNSNVTGTGSITAKIDGQSWASMTNGAVADVMQMDTSDGLGTMLQIIGTKADGSALTIQFPVSSLNPGTYTFTPDSDGLISYINPTTLEIYTSSETGGSFTLNITEFDVASGRLSGTFSGTMSSFGGDSSISVTDGHIDHVLLVGTSYYSGGSMTLSRNGGASFTMDADSDDGKYMMISENSVSDAVTLLGNNSSVSSDFGIYSLTFPKDIAAGTYTLVQDGDYSAGLGNSGDEAAYHLTSGTLTVATHSGNNVTGTFSYTVTNGTTTVNITNGSFDVTLQ